MKTYWQILSFTIRCAHVKGTVLKSACLTFLIQYLPDLLNPWNSKCNSKIHLNRKFSLSVKIRSGQKREKEYTLHKNKHSHTQKYCQKLPIFYFFTFLVIKDYSTVNNTKMVLLLKALHGQWPHRRTYHCYTQYCRANEKKRSSKNILTSFPERVEKVCPADYPQY